MKLLRIIKAKYKTTKEKLLGIEPEDWVKERRKICEICMFNSKNSKTRTLKQWFGKVLNLNKPHCNICLCIIKDLTNSETVDCSATPPKWKSII